METPLEIGKPASQAGTGYLTTLTIIMALGGLVSSFDSIIRGTTLPLVTKALHMNIAQGGLVLSGSFLVGFLAYLVIGPIMDRWGRKPAFLLALLATGLFTGLTAFVTSVWQFAILGLLTGVAMCEMYPAQVIVAEEAPAERRGILMAVAQMGWALGAMLVNVVAAVLLPSGQWRSLYLLAFSTFVVLILAWILVREPPRSLQALQMKRAGRGKGQGNRLATENQPEVRRISLSEWRQVFAPEYRKQTLVMGFYQLLTNIAMSFALFLGVTFMIHYDHIPIGAAALGIAVTSVAAIVGGVFVGYLADRWPARDIMITWWLIGGAALILLAVPGGIPWVYTLLAVHGFFGQGSNGTAARYFAECYPTHIRGTGGSFATGMFFLAGVFSLSLLSAIMESGQLAMTPVAAGVIAMVGALLLLMGKRIQPRKQLEEVAG